MNHVSIHKVKEHPFYYYYIDIDYDYCRGFDSIESLKDSLLNLFCQYNGKKELLIDVVIPFPSHDKIRIILHTDYYHISIDDIDDDNLDVFFLQSTENRWRKFLFEFSTRSIDDSIHMDFSVTEKKTLL